MPRLRPLFRLSCLTVLPVWLGLVIPGQTTAASSATKPGPTPPLPVAASPSDSRLLHLPEMFPVAMSFRATAGMANGEFAKRVAEAGPYPVIHGPGDIRKCRIMRQHWPQKIIIHQVAYGGVGAEDIASVWPGHFLYKVGTGLTHDCRPEDSVIQVEDSQLLAKRNGDTDTAEFPAAFTIYRLDSRNRPDWSQAEHVTLVRATNGSVVVNRGQWGSRPLAFRAGQAVVAAHMMFWTQQLQLNLSLDCPRGGPDNLTAAEWFARHVAEELVDSQADGIEFDVGRWTWGDPKGSAMDCNNDRIADYGYLAGVNSFGLGGQVLFRELRRILGPNKIIQADSNDPRFGVRDWNYLNGVQLECFPAENRFTLFSEAFSHLRRWVTEARGVPRFSYGFTKTPTTAFSKARATDARSTDFRFRVGLAADCLVGMPHPYASVGDIAFDPATPRRNGTKEVFALYDWDEYHGGDLNNWAWLGKPLAPARQHADELAAKNLLDGVSWQWKTGQGFEALCTDGAGGGTATVRGIPGSVPPTESVFGVRLEPAAHLSLKPHQEYTLAFDVRGDDIWRYAGQTFERVPRMVAIKGIAPAQRAGAASASVLAGADWYSCRMSLVTTDKPGDALALGVSEQIGRTELRNLRLFEGGCERWERDFEHGKVLLNMTKRPWKLNIGNGYRRLKGTQCPGVNTGARVNGPLEVPAWDALFLIKE